jgi:hypothetical protein
MPNSQVLAACKREVAGLAVKLDREVISPCPGYPYEKNSYIYT